MSKKKPKTATPPAADTAKPFRLIVHIGAGKTGTSSIQNTLGSCVEKLNEQGAIYAGLNLENTEKRLYAWQRASGFPELHALGSEQGALQLREALISILDEAKAKGMATVIWSNEALFNRGRVAQKILPELANSGIDVRIICYVRRHDAWARSSYIQWGLKHKTYKGKLQDFTEFRAKRPVEFSRHVMSWQEALGNRVILRNVDEIRDAVQDFFETSGLSMEGIQQMRKNEAPSGEELFLRSVFNSLSAGEVRPVDFDKVIKSRGLRFDVTPAQWLTELLPTDTMLEALKDAAVEDRTALDDLLRASNAGPIDTSPLQSKPVTVDPSRLLFVLSQILMSQAARLQQLENGTAEMRTVTAKTTAQSNVTTKSSVGQKPLAQPVFILSTGRSGSTLVQRLLNCHKDLVVWGEHHGFLQGIAEALTQMADPNNILYPKTPDENEGPQLLLPTLQNPGKQLEWSNPWSLAEFKVQARSFIESYFAARLEPGQRWGFKEIRYNKLSVMRGLRSLYPDGRFVFVKRDAVEVVRSKVMSFIKEERWATFTAEQQRARIRTMLAEVHEHYAAYDTFTKRNPALCTAVNLEDISSDSTTTIERLVFHLQLDPERFDWALARQVLDKVVARTRRDEELSDLIRSVDENDRK